MIKYPDMEINKLNLGFSNLLTASSEAKRTSPGAIEKNVLPAWDLTKGAITDPVATPTTSSIDLLNLFVIFDSFLTLRSRGEKNTIV